MTEFNSLGEVFAGLDHLALEAKKGAAAFAAHAKTKGLDKPTEALLRRFTTILTDFRHALGHIDAQFPQEWRKAT